MYDDWVKDLKISRDTHERKNKKLEEENKQLEDKKHWQQTMCDYMDFSDQWCEFDTWFKETIDDEDKEHEWCQVWMKNTEYEEEEDEE